MQDSGCDQFPAGLEHIADFLRLLCQQVTDQIGADEIVTLPWRLRQPRQISAPQGDANVVSLDVLAAGANGFGVVIERNHGTVTEFCGGDSQDARASADVQERLLRARAPAKAASTVSPPS